ncbi:two-component system, chemotaxis family, response regulator CheB [Flexibacter flexilis DSM 6793]|uniref:protein-glutamate methylesterase n=1 Tax=Flexibacter flexilis DSM 6793 TaxID=927664 RepID=A0A1I1I6H3_9BACT|nr:chemotaxis protein CheB [Flexibacter flexilis]SFC31907.1 two-component system, chemotaxis family, response regulator CheB [Flexibacter flexilis DSM 6793]
MDTSDYLTTHQYQAVVLGGSAGSIRVVCDILRKLRPDFQLPLIIVLHRSPQSESGLGKVFEPHSPLPIIEPKVKTRIENGNVYLAPADMHLFVESADYLNTDQSALVQYSRPSIDVLFFSASEIYQNQLLGILVTGANRDGAMGMKLIKDAGGYTVVQDPAEATIDYMPKSAMELSPIDQVLRATEIAELLNKL